MGKPRIVRSNKILKTCYSQLKKDDIICGRVKLCAGEEPLLTDLVERGIHLIPSGTCQLLSRSKVFQTQIFTDFLPKNSVAVFNFHDLLSTTTQYNQQNIGQVVLKMDRKDGGLGVHLFSNIESLYNHVSGGGFSFPFVVQPFMRSSRDIRIIIIGNYIEAYERTNPHNFRNNLHCGGVAAPFTLSKQQIDFCQTIMLRGSFPYAHLDLIIFENDDYNLLEINLKGGLRGALLTGKQYREKTEDIHETLLEAKLEEVYRRKTQ